MRVITRYAAASSYFAYRLQTDLASRTITLASTGSGLEIEFQVLLPAGWRPRKAGVTWNGKTVEFSALQAGGSDYVQFHSAGAQTGTACVQCE